MKQKGYEFQINAIMIERFIKFEFLKLEKAYRDHDINREDTKPKKGDIYRIRKSYL